MKKFRSLWKWLAVFFSGVLIAGLPWIYVRWKTQSRVFRSPPESFSAPVAIVFGAGVYRDGTPLPVLEDRVTTAVDLYKAGKVQKLLLTGDNRFPEHNEPKSMRNLALQLGVPEDDLVLDYAGRRTYDSCYRARFVFGVKKAILVTQEYHLPRAVYTCSQLGIDSIGVSADRRPYKLSSFIGWNLRELAACFFAILETQITRPQPVLGPVEPIE
jgi:vancomycin permeability regulator SanA